MMTQLQTNLRTKAYDVANASDKLLILVGDNREHIWYAKKFLPEAWNNVPRKATVSTLSDIDLNRLRVPAHLDLHVSNEWMATVTQDGSDDCLIELAWRTMFDEYVGHAGNLFHTWRQHHHQAPNACKDTLWGPHCSWTPARWQVTEDTKWFKAAVFTLIPIVRQLCQIQKSRELIEGSGLTASQVKPFDDVTPSAVEWAASEVAVLLLHNNNKIGADRVGRMLRSETAQYGLTFTECFERFQEAGKHANPHHHPVQQWSWLKTLIVYKLNPLRAASNQPTYLWVPVATGAEIHLDVEQAAAETTVAPQQPQPSRKRVADFTVDPATFRPVKTTWPNPRDSKASSSSSGAAVLWPTAKTPGAPPPLD
jgi:hypothetical protein